MELLYACNKYLFNTINDEYKDFLKSGKVTSNNILGIICNLKKFGLLSIDVGKTVENKLGSIIKDNTDNSKSLINSKEFLQLPHQVISKYFVKNEDCSVDEDMLFEKCVEYCKIQIATANSMQTNADVDQGDVKTDELEVSNLTISNSLDLIFS